MKHPRTWKLSIGLLLAIGILGCGEGPQPAGEDLPPEPTQTSEKVSLKLNLKQGERRKMAMAIDSRITASAGGRRQDIEVSIGFGVTFDVEDVDANGVQTLKVTYDRVQVRISGGPQTIRYDSAAGGPDNPATRMYAAMVGASLVTRITPEGETLEVRGLDELAERLAANAPPGTADQIRKQAQGMTGMFDQMKAVYPGKPVGIGDSWTSRMDVTSDPNMPLIVDATYTLNDRNSGVAIIGIDGKVSSTRGLSGKMTGTNHLEQQSGWPTLTKINLELSGNVAGAEMQMSQTITITGE